MFGFNDCSIASFMVHGIDMFLIVPRSMIQGLLTLSESGRPPSNHYLLSIGSVNLPEWSADVETHRQKLGVADSVNDRVISGPKWKLWSHFEVDMRDFKSQSES
jgi:hypothetical protein